MTPTVLVVCRAAVAPGFGLAGLTPRIAEEDDDVAAAIAEAARRPDSGVVLVQDELYAALPADTRARYDRAVRPIVVPFPGPAWTAAASAEDRVVALLRQAIGYRVKLR